MKKFTLLIRRVHLYSGLLLLPFVLLYASSALLFNHSTWLTDREVTSLSASRFSGTSFTGMDDAPELAAKVLKAAYDELEAESEKANAAIPGTPTQARFQGSYSFRVKHDGVKDSVAVSPTGQRGQWTTKPKGAPRAKLSNPFHSIKKLRVERPNPKELTEDLPDVLGLEGVGSGDVSLRSEPSLRFGFEYDGIPWKAQFDLRDGSFEAKPATPMSALKQWTTLITGLHKTHGHPASLDIRWLWAAVLDVMAGSLILWVVSGLLMWWQIPKLRRIGLCLIGVGILVAGSTVIGMLTRFDF